MARRTVLAALWITVVFAALEGASRVALLLMRPLMGEEIRTTRDIFREQSERIRVLVQPDTTRLLAIDSTLGWRYRANHRDATNRTNAAGLRSDRDYAPRPDRGITRVAAFGNSFVYCNEVGNDDSWPALVERMFPRLEVLNYGVGGYGTDQAFLRFLAEAPPARVMIMGFAPDDLGRLVNVYRRFRSNREIPLVKPRYLLQGDAGLSLLPAPLRSAADYAPYLAAPHRTTELGQHDQWYEPSIYDAPLYDYSATLRLMTETWIRARRLYFGRDRLLRRGMFNPASSAFRIQLALFQRFADSTRARGARSLIVLFPDQEALHAARRGKPTILTPLVSALRARGLEYVDLTDAFIAESAPSVRGWFMPGGHYSPLGNRLVAQWLGKRLEARQ